MANREHVLILGAGVTGLTSAVFLAEAGYQVTVVAAHVPGDQSIEYTSPWAGAHWLPHSTVNEPIQLDWDLQAYEYWLELLQQERDDVKLPRSGIRNIDSMEFWDTAPNQDLWWAPHVLDFRQMSAEQNPIAAINSRTPPSHPPVKHGVSHKAMVINVPQYLLYLQERARKSGAEVIKARLPTDGGLEGALAAAEDLAQANSRGKADCFVNATGLGAMKLCGDKSMFPIRGQTVLVKGESYATITRLGEGYGAYCIPRPGSGTTILGGTKQKGDWNEKPDPATTKTIMERNTWMCPELLTGEDGGFEFISTQCGLRPGREGGVRVEKKRLGARKLVHAYGHAGSGYQNSIGCARSVVKLVQESLDAVSSNARL